MKKIRVKVKFEILPKEVEREIEFDVATFSGDIVRELHEHCLAWAEENFECVLDYQTISVEQEYEED